MQGEATGGGGGGGGQDHKVGKYRGQILIESMDAEKPTFQLKRQLSNVNTFF